MLSRLLRILAVLVTITLCFAVGQAAHAGFLGDSIMSISTDTSDIIEVTFGYDRYTERQRVTSIDVGNEIVRTEIQGVERFTTWNELRQVEFAVKDWADLDGVAVEAVWSKEWSVSGPVPVPLFRYTVAGVTRNLYMISRAWLTPKFLVLATQETNGIHVLVLKYSVVDWFEAISVPY